MKTKQLDITYCKNCKFYSCKIIDKYSSIHTCRKNNRKFTSETPELFCNRPCYIKK